MEQITEKVKLTQGEERLARERKDLIQKSIKRMKNTNSLETEGYISGIRIGAKKKKQYTVMTVYGNNTSVEIFARIKDTSYLVKLTGCLKEEESMRNMRPTDEEEGVIRRLRRYKMTRYEAIKRLEKETKTKETNPKDMDGGNRR